jgi:peptidoglycan/LPS O-acetylase OafA/YrhL
MILQQRFGRGEDGLFMLLGWGASIYSLFYFNLDPAFACWALYFFPYFFMGILAQRALAGGRRWQFIAFLVVMALALFYEWRWRLLIAMIFGLALFFAERSERGRIWPPSLLVARIGEVSYSLFLLHFPVLVLTGALWSRLGWTSPEAAVGGLLTAFVASLLAAFVFYRWVEMPAARLSKRFRAPRQAAGPKANRRLAFEH